MVLIAINVCFLFASDDYDRSSNSAFSMGFSTLFQDNYRAGKHALDDDVPLHPLTFSSVLFGFGGHFRIIPFILQPGVYGDLHLSLLSILINCLCDNAADGKDDGDFTLFIQTGLRVYNQFGFGSFIIQPFFGLNLLGALGKNSAGVWYKAFGILFVCKNIGIEYGYQIPIRHHINNRRRAIHRIAAVFHVSP